jgi:translocator protein
MKTTTILTIVICIAIPLVIGGLSGFATTGAIDTWYAQLNKPSFNPPNYLFGPVWTILYILMGISLFLVWKSPSGNERNMALTIFVIQMVLNFAWTFLFFYFHRPGLALIEIIILWIAILLMIIAFYRIDKIASLLQIPYILWVSFASVLNGAIWFLNR